jgi:hypothetical protein
VPVDNVTDDDKLSPIFTTCGLFKRKSKIHRHMDRETPTLCILSKGFDGIIVLKAELKSTKRILA